MQLIFLLINVASYTICTLNDKKTDLKKEGKSTDAVDDLIIKIGHAPRRKFKVVEKESCRESRQQQAV